MEQNLNSSTTADVTTSSHTCTKPLVGGSYSPVALKRLIKKSEIILKENWDFYKNQRKKGLISTIERIAVIVNIKYYSDKIKEYKEILKTLP